MKRNRWLDNMSARLLFVVGVLLLPAFGISVVKAQERPAEGVVDELSKPRQKIQVDSATPTSGQRGAEQKGIVPAGPNIILAAPNRPFTLAASTGTVDED